MMNVRRLELSFSTHHSAFIIPHSFAPSLTVGLLPGKLMARIKDKVKNALDEARMLVLGAQVIVGLLFRSFFEKGFDALPIPSQALMLAGLGLMLVAVGLLISPAAYHRLVERGEDTEEIHRYTSKLMGFALLPFALGLGVGLYVATQKVVGWKAG